jgi:hypothetical protein
MALLNVEDVTIILGENDTVDILISESLKANAFL